MSASGATMGATGRSVEALSLGAIAGAGRAGSKSPRSARISRDCRSIANWSRSAACCCARSRRRRTIASMRLPGTSPAQARPVARRAGRRRRYRGGNLEPRRQSVRERSSPIFRALSASARSALPTEPAPRAFSSRPRPSRAPRTSRRSAVGAPISVRYRDAAAATGATIIRRSADVAAISLAERRGARRLYRDQSRTFRFRRGSWGGTRAGRPAARRVELRLARLWQSRRRVAADRSPGRVERARLGADQFGHLRRSARPR